VIQTERVVYVPTDPSYIQPPQTLYIEPPRRNVVVIRNNDNELRLLEQRNRRLMRELNQEIRNQPTRVFFVPRRRRQTSLQQQPVNIVIKKN